MTLLLSCQSLTKSFSARPLFQGITLGLSTGERMGLIGPNGSGKSTFLKILAGLEPADSGEISRRRDTRLVYIPQEDRFPLENTVGEVLDAVIRNEPLEDYERVAQIQTVLTRVGFTDDTQRVHTLSGGWKKRLALAHALIQRPDLLLMDEPTNHLDLNGVLWLETLLKEAPFAFLLVSHDRYLLDNATNRMMEMNRAYPEGYLAVPGSYSEFLTQKEAFLQAQAHQQQALASNVRREVDWLRRGAPARTTKAKARIDSAARMMDQLAELKFRNAQGRTVDIDFSSTQRKTSELLVAKDVAKQMGERTLFSHLDLILTPGTKLGLLGPNGSGKSTLIRLLTGEWEADSGIIKRAEGLRIVKFDQNRSELNRQESLRMALCPNGDNVIYRDSSTHVTAWARRFLFRPEQLDMPVGALSGGEQARVLIARLMLQPADLLILDEPTNDLDIPSLEVLEDSLSDFPGAIVLVTHDRYMLDQVSTLLLALDGKGDSQFLADYAQWERIQATLPAENPRKAAVPAAKVAPSAPRGLNTQERRELSQIEARILAAEEKVAELQRKMEDPKVVTDPGLLQSVWKDLEEAQQAVHTLYTRWDELETKKAG